ncbi:MAG: Bax inhibitor-1/YccA family protein [Caulobacteraceae bacterium]|nr:Bax inhibitor-1/YccA family protein [Caulobacter sp.]
MSDFNRGFGQSFPRDRGTSAAAPVDAGLRQFMLGVYNKMGLGLLLSAVLALVTSSQAVAPIFFQQVMTPRGMAVGLTLPGLILAFSPLVVILGSNFMMRNMSARSSGLLYWAVVALIGASLGLVFLLYTPASAAATFFATAAAFGGLSLIGYTTKRDLTGFGAFLIMGVWGLVAASIVNMFIGGAPLAYAISAIGVFIFAGLVAFETQMLKRTYYMVRGDGESMAVATNMGALNLYISFVNLFRFLLMFMGARR